MITNFILHVISAFASTVAFSILFNVQKKHIAICGLVGAAGWGVYIIGTDLGYSDVLSTFLGALVVATASYYLAKHRRAPVTVFLISGIIPLVPGIGLYRTMYSLLFAEYTEALGHALITFQMSGVIAGAIIIAALLPLFFKKPRKRLDP